MSEPFRTKSKASKSEKLPTGSTPDSQAFIKVEVPYTEYETENQRPYTVDYFDLGSFWERHADGYSKEVNFIEDYFNEKIKTGDIANDVSAVRNELRKIEKLTNIEDETRAAVRMGIVVAHIKFLSKVGRMKRKIAKRGII